MMWGGGRFGAWSPAIDERWLDAQSLADVFGRLVKGKTPDVGPEFDRIARAAAAEAMVTVAVQIGHEVRARVPARERAGAAQAASHASHWPELQKRQHVENGDVLADIGEIDPGHRNAQSLVRPLGLVVDRFPAVQAPIWRARSAR